MVWPDLAPLIIDHHHPTRNPAPPPIQISSLAHWGRVAYLGLSPSPKIELSLLQLALEVVFLRPVHETDAGSTGRRTSGDGCLRMHASLVAQQSPLIVGVAQDTGH